MVIFTYQNKQKNIAMNKKILPTPTATYATWCKKLKLTVSEAKANNLTIAELKNLYEEYKELALAYS